MCAGVIFLSFCNKRARSGSADECFTFFERAAAAVADVITRYLGRNVTTSTGYGLSFFVNTARLLF